MALQDLKWLCVSSYFKTHYLLVDNSFIQNQLLCTLLRANKTSDSIVQSAQAAAVVVGVAAAAYTLLGKPQTGEKQTQTTMFHYFTYLVYST